MRTEVPNLKRCCFCLPLRYGLLGWGYIKLFLSLFLLTCYLLTIIRTHFLDTSTSPEGLVDVETYYIISMIILSVILLVDISFNFVFIVGGHKKSHKLIRIYYYYLLVQITLNTIYIIVVMGMDLFNFIIYSYIFGWTSILNVVVFDGAMISYLILNVYILFLVRSEMVKFRDSCKFEFTNNAAENEAQCNLNVQ